MTATDIKDQVKSAYLEQLEVWGIDEEEAQHRGLKPQSEGEVSGLVPVSSKGKIKAAIPIPYWDFEGNPLKHKTVKTNGGHFMRVRFIYRPSQFGAKEDLAKYGQESGTDPMLYVPKAPVGGFLLDDSGKGFSWREVIENSDIPIMITEGEMKAATACQSHLPTVALGGVWSWRSINNGIFFLDQLEEIEWRQRRVVLIFDSDVATKKDVAMALNELAHMLFNRGARVFMANLPQEIIDNDGNKLDKVGLDDFILYQGVELLDEILLQAQPLTAVSKMFEFNTKLCFVHDIGTVYNLETGGIYAPNSLTRCFANVEFQFVAYDGVDQRGNPRFKGTKTNPMSEWIKWPLRMTADSLTYEPGQPVHLTNEYGARLLNVWRGWGCEPHPGDTKLFDELINWVTEAMTEEERRWFWQWLAYPIQHPGTKLNQAVICQGPQGSGKTLLGTIMGKIYGSNYAIIEQSHLQNDFNGWMHGRQFVVGDEISGTGSAEHRRVADKLKGYITGNTIAINRKNKEQYDLPNHCNFLFTTNHPDAFYIERDDRRYFVIEMPEKRCQEFYDQVVAWRDSDGGPAALMDKLLKLDLTGFNPSAEAPSTAHKETMRIEALTSLGEWLHETFFDGPVVCGGAENTCDLWTVDQIKTWFEASTGGKTTHKYIGQDLRRLGAVIAAGGTQIRNLTPGVAKARLWAIRDQARWSKATSDQARSHFLAHYASTEEIGRHEG